MTVLLLERAWVDGAFQDDVLVEIEDGRFTSVDVRGRVVDFEGVATHTESRFPRPGG